MQNLGAVLFSAMVSFKVAVRVGVILARWRELRTRYFSELFPASTLIIAGLVSEDLLIEVEATACWPVGCAMGV
jgi:enamine deaminase RidA (YjgF/YER057c/UK114 family)